LRITDGQHPHRPAGSMRQRGDQKTIAGVVAMPGKHGHLVCRRPLPYQCAPSRVRGALHQFEARRTRSDQPRIECSHLCGAIQRVG